MNSFDKGADASEGGLAAQAPIRLVPKSAFRSALPPDPIPFTHRVGRNLICETIIGENTIIGAYYTFQVMLAESEEPHLWDGKASSELIFCVKVWPPGDGDPKALYSGRDTLTLFPDPTFRARLVNLLVSSVHHLVREARPTRLFFVPKNQDLPPSAMLKYHRVAQKIEELGYNSALDAVTLPQEEVRHAWYFTRS